MATSPKGDVGNAAGILAILLWSATVGLFRSVGESLGAVGGAATIFTVSGVLVTLFAGIPSIRSLNKVYLFASGFLFVAYEISLSLSIGYAHNREQAMEVGMINYLWPSLTMLFAVLLRQQRASFILLAPGIALAFLGIAFVMRGDASLSADQLLRNLHANPVAYTLAFLAAFLWAAYSVLTRRYGSGKSAIGLFLLATAAALWARYFWDAQPAMAISPRVLTEVAMLGIFTATAYSAWNFGIQHGSMGLLAALSYFTPVLSASLASLWLGVRPSYAFWLGVAMVTAGSLISWAATRVAGRFPRKAGGPRSAPAE